MSQNAPKRKNINRSFRKIHRISSIWLLLFFLVISVTGILLGLKKHSGGYLLAKTSAGTSTNLQDWLPVDTLSVIAQKALTDSLSGKFSTEISRMDIRPDKGTAKVMFKNHFWAVQLDGATGKVLQIERRRSDIIEQIHTGLILDFYLKTGSEPVKLIYTVSMGLALLTLTITGFWLWYVPKRRKKEKQKP
jgi:uncharacterized iron-regulated membrane protein